MAARRTATDVTESVISLEGVSKVYGSEKNPLTVLDGIGLQVTKGEYVAITGPSGSGKSTILNILGCLDRPTKGAYRFLDRDVSRIPEPELSRVRNRQIGFVFQSFQLIAHLSVIENIELPLFYARMPRAERLLKRKQLAEAIGLGHRMDHLPSELSGGECQRTAIARALANEPSLLLADEPTGNLDSKTSRDILLLIAELHDKGHTIVMITHDPGIAKSTPRCIRLRDGRIEYDGSSGGSA